MYNMLLTLGRTTTRFHSFTDKNIPSVCDSLFVGNLISSDITDGKCPSAFLSSVIPHFVVKAVGKKKHCRWFYRQKLRAKKKSSCLKYTDGFIPLVSVCNTDKLLSSINSSVIVKCYCEMPTELFHRYIRR
jgi:hypothetical protein